VLQNIVEQQNQLIAILRAAASKSLPNNISFTYSQPIHRSGRSTGIPSSSFLPFSIRKMTKDRILRVGLFLLRLLLYYVRLFTTKGRTVKQTDRQEITQNAKKLQKAKSHNKISILPLHLSLILNTIKYAAWPTNWRPSGATLTDCHLDHSSELSHMSFAVVSSSSSLHHGSSR